MSKNNQDVKNLYEDLCRCYRESDSWWLSRFIVMLQFLDPFNIFVNIAWEKRGEKFGHTISEIIGFVKSIVVLLLLFLVPAGANNILLNVLLWFIIFIIVETILYLLYAVIIQKSQDSLSQIRTIVLLFINWATYTLAFAYIYKMIAITKGVIESIYFSFLLSSTLGFSNIYPTNSLEKIVVTLHVIITMLFLVIFFAYFIGKRPSKIQEQIDPTSK